VVSIPKGARPQVLFGSANRDEAAFPDRSDEFDISRSANATASQNLAFGRGVHFCLGANLARLECRVALELLASRLPTLHLDVDPATITWRPNAAFRGPAVLPIVW
jgi:cytochrome P450